MRSSILIYFRSILPIFLCIVLAGCNSQKETVASRGMQNLTAHYNILYNARLILEESERNIALAYQDNYEHILPVYHEPNEALSAPEIKRLDEAIFKANNIANEKNLSNYVDDAYFVTGKANHLKSNFYNAIEFFSYVYANYPEEKELRQTALVWKARSQMELDLLNEASVTLDSAFKYLPVEKASRADIYATRAQLLIHTHRDAEAVEILKLALGEKPPKQQRIRWTYILAQLQQLLGQDKEAFDNFSRIVKSNANFEMAFNANLSRISILDQDGSSQSRTDQLRALLRDDKNQEFQDQIYFQIANSYAEEGNIPAAVENYNAAIKAGIRNQSQKGQSYLRLAELYQGQTDFVNAKSYYDSALVALPKTYPDYSIIEKKAANLELLADRLTIIAREDTLQMLAALAEPERELRIGEIVRQQAAKSLGLPSADNTQTGMDSRVSAAAGGDTRFYFNNSIALNQGLLDFKRRWGNRRLEDNWRRIQKSAADMSNVISPDQPLANRIPGDPGIDPASGIESIRRTFIEGMPLTPELKIASDARIASAMFDIGNYYRDIAADTAQAVRTYERLLERYPDNSDKLAVYYNLYLMYLNANPARSEKYKQILLNDFPDSPFAKTILDPGYAQRVDQQDAAFNTFYNRAYDLYSNSSYAELLDFIQTYGRTFTGRPLPSQLDYLRALAIGHTSALPALETAFRELVQAYPNDQLVTPLVRQHLAFIEANRTELAARPLALEETDPNDDPFGRRETVLAAQVPPVQVTPAAPQTAAPQEPAAPQTPIEQTTPIVPQTPVPALPEQPTGDAGIFSQDELSDFYFVINVTNPGINLSSSRFGVGQFNRLNMRGSGISHQLKRISNQNQLIFVGPLKGRAAAEAYRLQITPLMTQIMKIPSTQYSTFIINQQNLDKLDTIETLSLYVDFFQKNF